MTVNLWPQHRPTLHKRARRKRESAHPELWPSVGAWLPALGRQGNRLVDVSGSRNAGSIEGDAAWSPESLVFDNSDDRVSIANQSISEHASGDAEFTLFARAKIYSTSIRNPLITKDSIRSNASNTDWGMGIGGNDLFGRISDGTNLNIIQGSDAINVGEWFTCAMRVGASSVTGFVNGVAVDSVARTITIANSSSPWLGWSDNGDDFLDGEIAAAYVFGASLPAASIRHLSMDYLAPFRLRDNTATMVSMFGGTTGPNMPAIAHHRRMMMSQ